MLPSDRFTPLANIFEMLANKGQVTPWTLANVPGFPYVEWSNMQAHYQPLLDWYNGIPLDEDVIDTETGETVKKYPLQLNPIPRTCEKHTSVLLGHTLESIRQGGLPFQFIPESNSNVDDVKIVSEALRTAFEYAGGGAMFVDNAITSQYMGGCAWQVEFHDDEEDHPIQAKILDVDEFFGVPKNGNHWVLREAWFVREITLGDAEDYGYKFNGYDVQFFYVEHWTEKQHTIHINTYKKLDEENPFGLVPIVYIPHIRTRNFIGKSIISEAVKGLVKEWNLRFADVGDAVSDDTHTEIAVRGVRGNIKKQTLPSGRVVADLGTGTGMTTNDTQPDMLAVKTQSASAPVITFIDRIEDQYRKEVTHPAIADGEDEGSQRSAATLVARMWPLISHIELERINWTAGLLQLIKIILVMYAVKGLFSITSDMAKIRFTIKWATPLPRDRETLINELAIRYKNHMTSLHHILELLGDVDDIDLEIAKIIEDLERTAEYEQRARGNQEGKNNQQPGDNTNTDAQNISTDD